MEFTVRKMTESDAVFCAEIEQECFSKPWTEQNFIDSLNNGTSVFYVACVGDTVIGFIGADDIGGEVYISNIAVKEKFRKNGTGSALINEMLNYCMTSDAVFITLEVRVSNENAIRLYTKFGFVNMGERKNFYSSPTENAIIMTKYFERND